MAARHRRTHITIALLVALVLVTALAAACSAQATGGALAASGASGDGVSTAPRPAPRPRAARPARPPPAKATDDDWSRIAKALAYMQADVADQAGRRPARRLRGPRVDDQRQRAGARRSTRTAGRRRWPGTWAPAIAPWPRTWPSCSTCPRASTSSSSSASTSARSPRRRRRPPSPCRRRRRPRSRSSNRTSTARPTSSPPRRRRPWCSSGSADRYPVFKSNFSTSTAVLAELITTCKDRGYKPVLFELPRNNAVIGGALDAPTTKYRDEVQEARRRVRHPLGQPHLRSQAAQRRLLRPLAPRGAGPHGVAEAAERQDGGPAQAVRVRWRLVTSSASAPCAQRPGSCSSSPWPPAWRA